MIRSLPGRIKRITQEEWLCTQLKINNFISPKTMVHYILWLSWYYLYRSHVIISRSHPIAQDILIIISIVKFCQNEIVAAKGFYSFVKLGINVLNIQIDLFLMEQLWIFWKLYGIPIIPNVFWETVLFLPLAYIFLLYSTAFNEMT